mmetsp:Transcript_527/g.2114  ORF Transcript_527/g.2114 Transcript_527/m.2114 type:complete len:280 (-) Transcript_527:4668-5507(-)
MQGALPPETGRQLEGLLCHRSWNGSLRLWNSTKTWAWWGHSSWPGKGTLVRQQRRGLRHRGRPPCLLHELSKGVSCASAPSLCGHLCEDLQCQGHVAGLRKRFQDDALPHNMDGEISRRTTSARSNHGRQSSVELLEVEKPPPDHCLCEIDSLQPDVFTDCSKPLRQLQVQPRYVGIELLQESQVDSNAQLVRDTLEHGQENLLRAPLTCNAVGNWHFRVKNLKDRLDKILQLAVVLQLSIGIRASFLDTKLVNLGKQRSKGLSLSTDVVRPSSTAMHT